MPRVRGLRKAMAPIGVGLLLAGSSGWADDPKGNHAVWGIGRTSCHSYRQARAGGEFQEYKIYAMGYLTAYNTIAPDTYNISGDTDLNGILSWLDSHCRKTPMDSFDHALKQMVIEMRDTRTKTAPGGQSWGRRPQEDAR